MYKTIVYCENDEFFIEREDKLNTFISEGMVYLQQQGGENIFSINKNKLVAIDLNKEVEQEQTYERYYSDGTKEVYDKDGKIKYIELMDNAKS